jgi:hypothetical protein
VNFPIFKSRDADNARVYAETAGPGSVRFTRTRGSETTHVYELSGGTADAECERLRLADSLSFASHYSGRQRPARNEED